MRRVFTILVLALSVSGCAFLGQTTGGVAAAAPSVSQSVETGAATGETAAEAAPELRPTHGLRVHYLEIVTPDVDAVCAAYAAGYGLTFGEPELLLGDARTARLPDGGLVGVRGPMRASETPVIRPYWLVEDIRASVHALVEAGVEFAHPPLELPGFGTFAIYIVGGVEVGLWQL